MFLQVTSADFCLKNSIVYSYVFLQESFAGYGLKQVVVAVIGLYK